MIFCNKFVTVYSGCRGENGLQQARGMETESWVGWLLQRSQPDVTVVCVGRNGREEKWTRTDKVREAEAGATESWPPSVQSPVQRQCSQRRHSTLPPPPVLPYCLKIGSAVEIRPVPQGRCFLS